MFSFCPLGLCPHARFDDDTRLYKEFVEQCNFTNIETHLGGCSQQNLHVSGKNVSKVVSYCEMLEFSQN